MASTVCSEVNFIGDLCTASIHPLKILELLMKKNLKGFFRQANGLNIHKKQRTTQMAYSKNRDYTLRGGKEAAISNSRQRMAESQHSESNSFVKGEQAKTKHMAGKPPMMEERYYRFDACMTNNGVHAQHLAKEITRGIDHEAYPVRQKPDEMQD